MSGQLPGSCDFLYAKLESIKFLSTINLNQLILSFSWCDPWRWTPRDWSIVLTVEVNSWDAVSQQKGPMQFPFKRCVPLARLVVEVGWLPGIRDTFQRIWMPVSPVGAWRPSLPQHLSPLGCLWSACLLKPPPQVTSSPIGPTAVFPHAPLALVSVVDHPLYLYSIKVSSSLCLSLPQSLCFFCLLPST